MTKQFFLPILSFLLIFAWDCTAQSSPSFPSKRVHPSDSVVKPSEQKFYESVLPKYQGKKLMLVTNPSGIGISPDKIQAELKANKIELVQMIGLEHGFFGLEEDFSQSPVTLDSTFNVPIYHIYRVNKADLAKLVASVDVIVFDVQDLGMRCYTYLTVLKRLMDEAKISKTKLVVLDHVHPAMYLGARGDTMSKNLENFAGEFPTLLFSGLTMAESALYYNAEFLNNEVVLEVVPVQNFSRSMKMDEVGIPWITPSPNLPMIDSGRNYFALVLLEGINVSVGRGTQAPFVYFGAPWFKNSEKVASYLEKEFGKDAHFQTVYFKPSFGPYKGQICKGLRMNLIKDEYDPIKLSYLLISAIYHEYPQDIKWNKGKSFSIDLLWGSDRFRKAVEAKIPLDQFLSQLKPNEDKHNPIYKKYHLYK